MIRRWLRLFPGDPARDVDDELDFHIEQRIAEYVREGLTPDQAKARAHARFGDRISARNATLTEDTRRMRAEQRTFFLRDIGQDLRFAFRTLRRQRLPAALAALCVALGIGSTTAVLSVGDALLLRPLPFPNGERLVSIGTETPGRPLSANDVNSFEDFADWRARNRSFVDVAAQAGTNVTLGTTDPIRAGAALVSASLWRVLGARIDQGRAFTEAEDKPGGPRVVMVSRGFAERNWGSVDAFSGKQLTINGRTYDVIGVVGTPARFPESADLWLPIARAPEEARRGVRSYAVIAQLKPGVTLDAAQREMSTIAADIAREHPENNAKRGVALAPLRERYVGAARDGFRIAAGAALLVLLIACANVACLQLARGSARAREISVRTALGASRLRLIRQLLTENVMLALAGGAAGVALGVWGSTYVGRAVAENAPAWMTFRLNVTVLVATTIICVAAGILFGMVPALGFTRASPATSLRAVGAATMGRGTGRMQRALAVAELALTVVLVCTATLAVESFVRLSRVDIGFDANNLQTFRIGLTGDRYDSEDARRMTVQSIVDGLRNIPGVEGATVAAYAPIRDCCSRFGITADGKEYAAEREMMVSGNQVTPGFFGVMGIEMQSGRDFTLDDRSTTEPVVIVSESFAKHFWPNETALGKPVNEGSNKLTVIGVVADVKQSTLLDAPEPQFYRPHAQQPWETMTFVLRVRQGVTLTAKDVRAVVHAVDGTIAVGGLLGMSAVVERTLAPKRIFGAIVAAFGIVALALAIAGIYGVLAFQVSRRGQEIGVRMALGAQRPQVLREVLGQAGRLAAVGIGVGVVGAVAAGRALGSTLYGVEWESPWRYAAVVMLLAVSTLAAATGPAWRASRVDPMRALRSD